MGVVVGGENLWGWSMEFNERVMREDNKLIIITTT